MTPQREALLARLKRFGEENDRRVADRAEKMLNITADTGLFLWMLLRVSKPRHLLEVGTSNAYSTIWIADALGEGQELTTLEHDARKIAMARANLAEAGLTDRVSLVAGDAGAFLREAPAARYDFVFLDADRTQYPVWWPDLYRVTAPGGLLVVDNAVDKAPELEPFMAMVRHTAGVREVLVPIGNGERLIYREKQDDHPEDPA